MKSEKGQETNVDQKSIDTFKAKFGYAPSRVVRAPGRVNLIGEHTDYNGGFVFPAAIDRWMTIAAHPSSSGAVNVVSLDYEDEDHFAINQIEKSNKQWSNYLRGVLEIFQEQGHRITGFDAVLSGNVPQGAGLSSSAAYEVAVASLLNDICDLRIDGTAIALLAQEAENIFIGVQCGIMDQFISALGQSDSALLIDCHSLEYRSVRLELEKHRLSIVITNSGVRRELLNGEYNKRRSECAEGIEALGICLNRNVRTLRDINLSELNKHKDTMPEHVFKRCRHVVTENQRVLDAVAALEAGNLSQFGQLMNQSHLSLQNDYEVSCTELDVLVDLTQKHSGTVGARMTGAGFGGCTVAIMENSKVDAFIKTVIPVYEHITKQQADVYVCRSVRGACTDSDIVDS